ncbi:ribosomal protein S18-alanine N-acetyltransferase [Tomitella gaofuii]|uniref:ribosomal protein S18-alanine N-acetyltransferase n=1 Tax=Tomitella gaofuii TaxID=2760083 RepID=UPI001F1A0863|nr:ribosomal protein S18-alanine N-acetyltransferase [Tomitella gaofuii]
MSAPGGDETGGITVGPLEFADAHACAALERLLFAGESPWPAAAFAEELRAPHTRFFAARRSSPQHPRPWLVGYAGIALLGGAEPESEVHTIAVDPKVQGRGVGRRLLALLLAEADAHGGPVFLDVRTDNAPAIALYRSEGFENVGLRPRYYQPSGADAYVMCRRAAEDTDGKENAR